MEKLFVTVALLVAGLGWNATPAQTVGSTLSGKIVSSTNSSIPRVNVTLKDTSTSHTEVVTVGQDGSFTIRNLAPGTYEITASAPGFATSTVAVTIGPAGDQVANIVMQPEATGTGGKAEGSTSGVSGVVGTKNVTELPLNGRSASDLAALEPGVSSARTQQTGQAQRGFGNQMTISGGRPRQNDARLDGISVNDYVNGPPGSALGVSLGSDAVEQFSVLTSNYPAQYGRSSGGIIGASTRSGTANFHGDAFEYIRNSALDARNFFDTSKPPFRRNQFGGSAGGPIWKDRTFIFAGQQVTPENYFTTKVDHKLSESDALDGTYMFDSGTVRQPDELNNKRTGYNSRRQMFTI